MIFSVYFSTYSILIDANKIKNMMAIQTLTATNRKHEKSKVDSQSIWNYDNSFSSWF